ncbi:hypothetical protein M885DRAFT_526047 [Pelagophyceae sp. CCMP2097]|nr:hypothetical protein M885DRAFT_526047 [Pelagophyceae sp. CCMP2097]
MASQQLTKRVSGVGGLELGEVTIDDEEYDRRRETEFAGEDDAFDDGRGPRESTASRICFMAIYLALNAATLAALFTTTGTDLEARPLSSRSIELYVYCAVAVLLYFAVRQSDPGYVNAPVPPLAGDGQGRAARERRRAAAADATAALTAQLAARETPESTLLPWPSWPPMRTAYCKPTRRWVATYDHYCPVLSVAVGERNRGRFWLYLLMQTLALSRAAGAAESAVRWSDVSAGAERPMVLCLALWAGFGLVGMLWIFHCFLCLTNLTTHEFLSAGHVDYLHNTEDFDLPFTRGLCGNAEIYFLQDGAAAALCRRNWSPTPWVRPAIIDRDSEDWWNNPWQNKYWSCC